MDSVATDKNYLQLHEPPKGNRLCWKNLRAKLKLDSLFQQINYQWLTNIAADTNKSAVFCPIERYFRIITAIKLI